LRHLKVVGVTRKNKTAGLKGEKGRSPDAPNRSQDATEPKESMTRGGSNHGL